MWSRSDSAHAQHWWPQGSQEKAGGERGKFERCVSPGERPTNRLIRKDGRRRFVEKWQTTWHGDQSGRWTHRLIPELATWLDRKHGQVGFYLAQALSGHGCFNLYLKRFKKRDDESCRYCGSLVENAEHTLFVCARWGAEREAVGRAVGAHLTPDLSEQI